MSITIIECLKKFATPLGGMEFGLRISGRELTYADVLRIMDVEPALWHTLLKGAVLACNDSSAVFMEWPRITQHTITAPFRCALTGTNELAGVKPNPKAFNIDSEHEVVITPNLSGDAMLVIPSLQAKRDYSHLRAFLENCTDQRLIEIYWKNTANQIRQAVKRTGYTWVSTHGLGIPWLHIRISTVPKYYVHGAYLQD